MKTLNRTLSLVLVLVMVLGFFGVAGAAFKDQTDVKYTEAVDVMAGIGAIDGYADGTFNPKGAITREEAAKLVVYSILGKSVAEKLTVSATSFSDVAASRWSAPYISYLVGKGVINGMGDGTFAPTANVTGYQMAKMMLTAAGYGAKGEFTGDGWELAVAVTGNKVEIFDAAEGVDFTKPATREEATLYAFNGIFIPQVQYNAVLGGYVAKGTVMGDVKDGAPIRNEVYPSLYWDGATVDGVAGRVWNYKGVKISGFVPSAKLLASSSNGTNIANLIDNTKTAYIGYKPEMKADGTAVEVDFYVTGETTALNQPAPTAKAVEYSKLNGTAVKFFDTNSNGRYDIVTVVRETLAKKVAAPIVKTTGEVTKVTMTSIAGLYEIEAKNVIGYQNIAKDDYVLWHQDADGRFVLSKASSITGTLNAYNETADVLVIDGKQYEISGAVNAEAIATLKELAGLADSTFYTDAAGYIVAGVAKEEAQTLANTMFLNNAKVVGYTAQATVVFPDAQSTVITIAKIDSESPIQADGINKNVKLADTKFYTYTKNENGTYNLKTIASNQSEVNYTNVANDNSKAVITSGKADFLKAAGATTAVGSLYGTATTAFVFVGATSNQAYTGISNVPTYKTPADASNTDIYYLKNAANLATFVVAVGGVADTAVANSDIFFTTGTGSFVHGANNTSFYQYKAVVKGAEGTIDATVDTLLPGMLYSATNRENGKVSVADQSSDLIYDFGSGAKVLTDIDDFKVYGTTVIAGSSSFVVDKDVKVFIYDLTTGTPKLQASSIDVVDALTGGVYTAQAVQKSTTDKTIVELYVTSAKVDDAGLKTAAYTGFLGVAPTTANFTKVTAAANLADTANLMGGTTKNVSDTNSKVAYVKLFAPLGATVTAVSATPANASVASGGSAEFKGVMMEHTFAITDVNPGAAGDVVITFTVTSEDTNVSTTHTMTVTVVGS